MFKPLIVIGLAFFAGSAFACDRKEVDAGTYILEEFGWDIRCDCDEGDTIVAGGCYVRFDGHLYTNIPNYKDGVWYWVCEGRGAGRSDSESVHLRLICKKSDKNAAKLLSEKF